METQASYRQESYRDSTQFVFPAVVAALVLGLGVKAIEDWIPAPVARYQKVVQAGIGPRPAPALITSTAPAGTACPRCGVVESVRQVGTARNFAEAGVAAGAFGGDLTIVLAVVVSALTGNRFDDNSKAAAVYEVIVRFEDGSSRMLTSVSTRAWQRGDQVKVIHGRIQPNV